MPVTAPTTSTSSEAAVQPFQVTGVVYQPVDPAYPAERLRYVSFSHTEADECGSLNEWLAIAPRAVIATPGNGAILPGGGNWLNTRPQGWYPVMTDGKRMWVEQNR